MKIALLGIDRSCRRERLNKLQDQADKYVKSSRLKKAKCNPRYYRQIFARSITGSGEVLILSAHQDNPRLNEMLAAPRQQRMHRKRKSELTGWPGTNRTGDYRDAALDSNAQIRMRLWRH